MLSSLAKDFEKVWIRMEVFCILLCTYRCLKDVFRNCNKMLVVCMNKLY